MGLRLHISIPNVKEYDSDMELGKRYDSTWHDFNERWFEGGYIHDLVLDSDEAQYFLDDLIEVDKVNVENGSIYTLYNLELAQELIDYAKQNNYDVLFTSY